MMVRWDEAKYRGHEYPAVAFALDPMMGNVKSAECSLTRSLLFVLLWAFCGGSSKFTNTGQSEGDSLGC